MFGYGQFSRTGRYKLSDNEKFLGGNFAPFTPAISGTGAGTTSATPGNGYTYQTFTASGTLYVDQPITADILVVAGGGSGGKTSFYSQTASGGGGSGGLVYVPNISVASGSYTVVIGAGAADPANNNGTPSYILTGAGTTFVVAAGGGCGGQNFSPTQQPINVTLAGKPGGSGGGHAAGSGDTINTYIPIPAPSGGGGLLTAAAVTQPTLNQPGLSPGTYLQYGFPGGTGYNSFPSSNPHYAGAGGGGAAVAGGPTGALPTTQPGGVNGGAGGNGRQYTIFSGSLIGVPVLGPLNGYFAGGGGGGAWGALPSTPGNPGPQPGGLGGLGGGGKGGKGAWPGPPVAEQQAGLGVNGTENTGGGGGGNGWGPVGAPYLPIPGVNSQGGSGIVIIRYQVSP